MATILADMLRGVRDYFDRHPEPLEQMRKIEAR
jgi:hypothetical protein